MGEILTLWDIDGTLISSGGSKSHKAAFRRGIKIVFDVEGGQEDIITHGKTDQQILLEILELKDVPREVGKAKMEESIAVIVGEYDKISAEDKVDPLEGVRELLEEFKNKDILMGLVTGNIEKIGRSKLDKAGIGNHFKLGGFGSDAHETRTDLVKLAIIKAREQGFSGEKVFLFGDAPADMVAGKEGGAVTIGVTTGVYNAKQLKDAGADYTVDSLADKEQILKILT